MKILALDFDGVICNSIDECLITSYNAFCVVEGMSAQKVYNLAKIDPDYVKKFREFRYLVRTAPEYCYLCQLLKEGQYIDPEKNLNEQCIIHKKKIDTFRKQFFHERNIWITENKKNWLSYNHIYPGLIKPLNKIHKNTVIVSSKDFNAIKDIFNHYGILIHQDNIFGSDSGKDKEEIFMDLIQRFKIQYRDITFVDDNHENIQKALDLGIKPIFALWGYSSEKQKKRIKKNKSNIQSFNLETFIKFIGNF